MQQQPIETARLILRPLTEDDAEGMFRLDSDPEVHRYIGNKPIKTLQEAMDVITFIRQQYIDNGIGRWAVIERSTGNFLGWAGLKLMRTYINGHIDHYDIGYRLIPEYWNKGYATESALAWKDHALNTLKVDKIYGVAHIDNAASNRILQKTGLQFVEQFEHEGIQCNWYELASPFIGQ
jgi:RimJ/RimL family protein N-acetyltransferase